MLLVWDFRTANKISLYWTVHNYSSMYELLVAEVLASHIPNRIFLYLAAHSRKTTFQAELADLRRIPNRIFLCSPVRSYKSTPFWTGDAVDFVLAAWTVDFAHSVPAA